MRRPPKKRAGQPSGRGIFNGVLWDVSTGARELGLKEKALRSQIARGVLPHRRLGGRIVLIAEECREFLRRLPGVTVDQALANVAARTGDMAEKLNGNRVGQ
jgi:hypothetical protein